MVIGKSKLQLKPAMIFKGYGQKPLCSIGMFTAKLSLSGRHFRTDFYVMDEDDTPILWLVAAGDLGLMDAKINSMSMSSKATVQESEKSTRMPDLYQKYPQLYSETLEPRKNFSYEIQNDPNATPIAQKERVRLMQCNLGRKAQSKRCCLWVLLKNAPKVGGYIWFM